MAQLFSKGKIRQEVGAVAGLDIARAVAIVQQLHAEWKNGNADDETRYEQSFNQLFFNELLGYTRNDHMHPKAGTPVGGKIADLGLGLFREGKYNFDDVQVVVELKGAKIFLDKKQNRQNPQSPVDQGFGYKTSFTKCKRLIVSNFHQVRLYRDNKQDYQEWTLQDLASGHDNWFALRSLLVLLSANRLLSSDGESHTEKLMSQFRIEQQKITKKFYQEYKGLRLDLINDIRQHNSGISIEIVVEKAQKIIDRLVFVHFCEDKGLLPADKLKENIVRAREADFTPWEILKKYFKGVDSGSEKLGIPGGYNGELFKPDAVLDSLIVGDAICMKFIHFGDYDFDDELSVNILGHIFEQSISDLEQLKIDLLGTEIETDQLVENKKQSKRKKDGIFYTPEYIVDYIIQNSLMKYLSEKEDECLAKYKDEQKAYQAYQQILQNVKVLDPACGSGAFLVKVFDVLYAENQRVGILIGGLFDETETYKNILTNNIYGVDLNPESVEITKLSLWLKSAQKGKKLNNLDKNIKCGNSLIDDPAVAGERAFDWHKEFKHIMDVGGFDVIVGNPPYVVIGNFDELSNKFLKEKYESADGKFDLYYLFIELSIRLLSNSGEFSMILPNKFFHTKSAKFLRSILLRDKLISSIVDFSDHQIFDGATTYTCILSISKSQKKFFKYIQSKNDLDVGNYIDIPISNLSDDIWQFSSDLIVGIFNKIKKKSVLLKDITTRFGTGAQSGSDRILSFVKGSYPFEEGTSSTIFRGRDVRRYYTAEGQNLIFPYDDDFSVWDEDLLRSKYPKLYKYLIDNKHLLESRIWFGKNADQLSGAWYGMMYLDAKDNFQKPHILSPCLSDVPNFSLGTGDLFANGTAGVVSIIPNSEFGYHINFLLSYLNSSLIRFIVKQISPVFSGGYYKYSAPYLKKLPIPKNVDQQPFIDKADQMLSLNKEFHEKKSSALALLQAEYGIEKISRKLENFWELDFADFVKALGVKSLSLDKKEELMGWFGKKKEELASLQAMIDQADREIDGMVYELYGLSEEEIAVVEG